jgi:hypothetical protein
LKQWTDWKFQKRKSVPLGTFWNDILQHASSGISTEKSAKKIHLRFFFALLSFTLFHNGVLLPGCWVPGTKIGASVKARFPTGMPGLPPFPRTLITTNLPFLGMNSPSCHL